jgi:hypothetical protein
VYSDMVSSYWSIGDIRRVVALAKNPKLWKWNGGWECGYDKWNI